ncbi:hypothetical protein D9613_008171 [Agrocybe pediades]|uniref:Uncharacterized protein n=1 Tax=Agrocybe pediades TaxID=84607 RepID=A0A8H4QN73_9AGAR|nr:hypothetical protein D9613_008171 [Agrocybe pediades]
MVYITLPIIYSEAHARRVERRALGSDTSGPDPEHAISGKFNRPSSLLYHHHGSLNTAIPNHHRPPSPPPPPLSSPPPPPLTQPPPCPYQLHLHGAPPTPSPPSPQPPPCRHHHCPPNHHAARSPPASTGPANHCPRHAIQLVGIKRRGSPNRRRRGEESRTEGGGNG